EDMASWFYVPSWRKLPRAPGEQQETRVAHWVVLGAGFGAWEAELTASLESDGARVYRLSEIDPGALDRFWQEKREIEGVWGLVDLRGAAELQGVAELRSAAAGVRRDGLYEGLLAVLQAATRARIRFAQVEVIACGLVEAPGERVEAPGLGIVEGLTRMLPVELPGTRVRILDSGCSDGPVSAAVVAAELGRAAADGVTIALRKGARWQEEWLPIRLEGGQATRFREGGVYLITGGLGGVGFVMARYLLERYGAKVALVGRTALPAREQWESWLTERGPAEATSVRIARMKELEEIAAKSGGAVMLSSADVADRAGMAAVWHAVENRLGVVRGVIHAAGLGANERLMTQSAASVERVLSPKVRGSEVLAELSVDKGLDFLLFCSSISAVHPIPGAAPYAAANAFQDRYAVWTREHLGVPAVSINLDRWRNLGMAADDDLPEEFADLKRALQAKAMSAEEGIEVIERVLASGEPRILVSTLDLGEVLADTAAQLEAAGARESAGKTEAGEQSPETEAVIAIWRELLGTEWIGPTDNFFELGGHSLLGTMVLARIRERFGVELTIRAIFEAPTPASLGVRIREAEPIREVLVEEEPVNAGGEREEFEI
ncbi:MAG TPA: KR domain-containing protein, partial [Acidobacteriaceae bacterium]